MIGLTLSTLAERIREPVMTMSSSPAGVSGTPVAPGATGGWAHAGVAAATMTVVASNSARMDVVMVKYPRVWLNIVSASGVL